MADSSRTTVLHVEDNAIGRYAVSRILRRDGFHVVEAANGMEALRLARDNPDLILLDVNMPDMDGFEVCRRLKADPATKIIPVLHLSATCISSEHHVAGLELGADGFLSEPVDPPLLTATIKALLRMRRAGEAGHDVARQWQTAFDALGDGVCLIDGAGRIQRCNRAMAGFLGIEHQDEILGKEYTVVVPGLESILGGTPLVLARDCGQRVSGELTIDGRRFTVSVNPLPAAADAAPGAVLIFAEARNPGSA